MRIEISSKVIPAKMNKGGVMKKNCRRLYTLGENKTM